MTSGQGAANTKNTYRGKLLLVDGYSLIFRAFYALPPLQNAEGQPTNAVYGFLNMLLKLLDDEQPTHLVVALDAPGPTFRDELFSAYKAHRPETPDELKSQIPLAIEALQALGIPVLQLEGYEADDIIGTLSRKARKQQLEVVVVTGDKDLLQVVDQGVRALITRRGITDLAAYDEGAVRERYGITPSQWIDVKALMGDPSDNIPGVPGVGEKTALKLVQQFGSVENLLDNLDQVGGKKLPATLEQHKQAALDGKKLATIVTDAPIHVDWDACRRVEPDAGAVRPLFLRLGFRSLLDRLGATGVDEVPTDGHDSINVTLVNDRTTLEELLERLRGTSGKLGITYRLAGPDQRYAPVTYLCIADPQRAWLLYGQEALGNEPANVDAVLREIDLLNVFSTALQRAASGQLQLIVHDLKPLLRRCFRSGLWSVCPTIFGDTTPMDQLPVFDTVVAAYLLDPNRNAFPISQLAQQFLQEQVVEPEDLTPKDGKRAGKRPLLAAYDLEQLMQVAGRQSKLLMSLADAMASELSALQLEPLFTEIEAPLTEVLAAMEHTGVAVDREALQAMGQQFAARIKELTSEIYQLAGVEFNINSPQQLGQVLFEKLKLPVIKKTKTGYSTDAEVLEQLIDEHPIAAKVLEHRSLSKLVGTYVDGLVDEIEADGRIHTTFQQTVAATGRLASTSPNLQNIPVRDERGRGLRKAFTAAPGHELLALDYSQIELRVLAHMSKDPLMIEAFRRGDDIHRRTAAEVFQVEPEQVTPEMREFAKAVNFGLVYGQTDFGLARQLGISRAEARRFIDRYFERYQGVQRYLRQTVQQAREQGYVRTLLGRIRYLPDIKSRIFHRRSFAERTAMNTPVQGTAADIIKAAMVRVYRRLQQENYKAQLVLQIHDELILEVPVEEREPVARLVVDEMVGAAKLDVPLVVEAKVGPNWYDMRRLDLSSA